MTEKENDLSKIWEKNKQEVLSKGYDSSSQKGGAVKDDAKKLRMSLIPILAKRAISAVMTYGSRKYKKYNWAEGFEYTILADAAERHIDSWRCGEDLDPDSGLPHLAHALCSLMMLLENTLIYGDKLDDRWEGWKREECKKALAKSQEPLNFKIPEKNEPTT